MRKILEIVKNQSIGVIALIISIYQFLNLIGTF